MRKELEDKLIKEFPFVVPTDGFGIGVGDGWYDILHIICWYIKQRVHENNVRWDHWKSLTGKKADEYKYKPISRIDEMPTIGQIKEKFGGLRFYTNGLPSQIYDEIKGIIEMGESMSFHICEECGNKGRPNNDGWITTLCDECRGKRD